MLVLTRKPGQSLFIGEDIKVSVMEIRGNQVRVGILAPPTVRIYREEIYTQILEENKEASEFSHLGASELKGALSTWKIRKPDGS